MPPIGFIQDDLDLKLLILYIMDRAAGPITFLQLFELALCDAGVDYFSLNQAVNHMVATGQLTFEEDRYAITDKGRRNSQICESSLPPSVRWHCDQNLIQVNDALRREAQVRVQILDKEDGTATLCLTLEDGSSPLFLQPGAGGAMGTGLSGGPLRPLFEHHQAAGPTKGGPS